MQSSGKAASPVVLKLRSLMEKVETTKAEREAVESEFTSPAEDMGEELSNGAKLIDIHSFRSLILFIF